MKSQDKAKLHQSSVTELQSQLANLRRQLVQTRHLIQIGKEKNLKSASNLKHQIAIIKTIISQKQAS